MTRIVKMKFKKENIEAFLAIFKASKDKISAYEGCQSVVLVQDNFDPTTFFTLSQWKSIDALNNYRHSDLFMATWEKTKILFDAKPKAWSTFEPKLD